MKAKDYAQRIHDKAYDREETYAVIKDILIECRDMAKTRKQAASMLAVFREGFQKWKAVCAALVAKATPQQWPEGMDALFPIALKIYSSEIFWLCIKNNIFLGYELTEEDKEDMAKSAANEQTRLAEQNFWTAVANQVFR